MLAAEGAAFSNVITRYAPDGAFTAAHHLAAAAGVAALDRGGNAADAAATAAAVMAVVAFDIWHLDSPPLVRLEHGAPASWSRGLRERGYEVAQSPPGDQSFGHAQVIQVTDEGLLSGAADPRAGDGAFTGR